MSPAYNGLVKMHAQEIAARPAFRRTRRLSTSDVHEIAKDLDKLGQPHPLDETIDAILLRAEAQAIEIERAHFTKEASR